MTRRQQKRLCQLVTDYILLHGGYIVETREDIGEANGKVWHMTINVLEIVTMAGLMRCVPYGDWIACRFDDVQKAKTLLYSGQGSRLNPYSGKWNHGVYSDNFDAETAFHCLRNELERLLPLQKEVIST